MPEIQTDSAGEPQAVCIRIHAVGVRLLRGAPSSNASMHAGGGAYASAHHHASASERDALESLELRISQCARRPLLSTGTGTPPGSDRMWK